MSVIAVRKSRRKPHKWKFAHDSIMVTNSQITPPNAIPYSKVWQVNGMTVGATGMVSEALMMELFNMGQRPIDSDMETMIDYTLNFCRFIKQKTGANDMGNQYLMGVDHKVFHVWGKGSVLEVKDYFAIGAGTVEANSAMRVGASAKEAVECACDLNIYCRTPVIEVTHRG